ncbi:unnamed protein product [Eruca vesicaria subsp. sativa]|uniref:PRA1 family protein n=1 Tax=Eruca vesicaria subsp. sativa TaxID=29727 RepID=A0ABC8LAS5_ERUVS|nr:unnamed protein product [Eruca vesicaria subsp. sativa]
MYSDTTTRVTHNCTHFRFKYTIILFVLLSLTLITRHIAILTFGLAWFFLCFARKNVLTIIIFTVYDGVMAVLLIGFTIALLTVTGVWLSVHHHRWI